MQKPIAEAVGKQVALLLGAIYLLGVLIVNFHLAEYKVAGQFGLLRPIYLFAGLYSIVPIAVSFAFFCLVTGATKKGHLWVKIVAVGLLCAAMWGLSAASLNAFDFYVARDFPLKWDKWMWIHLLLALLLGAAAHLLLLGRWKPSEKSHLPSRVLLVMPGLLVWLIYGYAFSVRFYNRIPSSWEGTRSSFVEFILDPNDQALRAELERAGVRFYPGTARTRDTKLILQTESDFVCAVKQVSEGKMVVSPFLLRRDVVIAIKYGGYGY